MGVILWALCHKVVVYNYWRPRFVTDVDYKCHMCGRDIPETRAHNFWDCKVARRAWEFAIRISDVMKAKNTQMGPWN